MSEPSMPTPEQIQQRLAELLHATFGQKIEPDSVAPKTPQVQEDEIEEKTDFSEIFEFDFTPKDIKRHLDRFVIKQDEAKKVLSIAVCDHYNHAKYVAQKIQENDGAVIEYAKQNVILIGPSGVGKTYLVKHIADLIGVPFVKADATKFSETGYVGGDVEDLVRELVQKADGNIELAEHGVIYIDEIDKIASSGGVVGRDVSGRGVQTTLLKLMEETEVSVRNPMDLQSQLQAAFEFQHLGGKKSKRDSINTRHILFIVSGAFDKLSEQIQQRLRKTRLGFGAEPVTLVEEGESLRQVITKDLMTYGMEPEFIGRLPVRVICDPLSADDLYEIMKHSEGSIIRQYERAFQAYGVEVFFEDGALRKIAKLAVDEKTGARGLLTICERLLRDFKYELPTSGVSSFSVTEKLIDSPQKALEQLLQKGRTQKKTTSSTIVNQYAQRFQDQYQLTLIFRPATVARILERAQREACGVRELCERLFKDYQFGLQLIKKNNGCSQFTIPVRAVEDPDGTLSEWVVQSYRGGEVILRLVASPN